VKTQLSRAFGVLSKLKQYKTLNHWEHSVKNELEMKQHERIRW